MGQLLQGSKSDLMKYLTNPSQSARFHPGIDATVLDRAAIVHMVRPRACRTFEEYFQQMSLPYTTSQPETVSRVNIVWDRYLTHSLKQCTRDHRRYSDTTQRQRVIAGVPMPANCEAILRSNANKDYLFCYPSECIQACDTGRKVNISTKDETIVSTQNYMNDVEYLQPCSYEESDARILFNVAHCARKGLRKVVIRTLDTYVVAFAIEHFSALRLDELWVSWGVGTHFGLMNYGLAGESVPTFDRLLSTRLLKNVNEKAMMFLHAINRCDTVSSFLGFGKKSAWLAWSFGPSVTDALLGLSLQAVDVSSETV